MMDRSLIDLRRLDKRHREEESRKIDSAYTRRRKKKIHVYQDKFIESISITKLNPNCSTFVRLLLD